MTGSSEATESSKGGRPRNDATRRAILDAAYDELRDVGFRAVTMEGVAKRAGASKSTLYRWWTSKAAILLEAVNERGVRYPQFGDTGSVYEDILEEIRGVITFYLSESGSAMVDLIAEGRFDADLAQAVSENFIALRRAATRATYKIGVERGELRADADVEVVMDALWGALYYRLIVSHEQLDLGYADRLLNTFWPALQSTHPR